MPKASLLKKFSRAERKMSDSTVGLSPLEHIALIKEKNQSVAVLSRIINEDVWSDRLLAKVLPRIFKKTFDAFYVQDQENIMEQSSMSMDYFVAIAKTIGDLNGYGLFKESGHSVFFDCSSKDIFFTLKLSLVEMANPKKLEITANSLNQKLSHLLAPYGGQCVLRYTAQLIDSKRFFSIMINLNRLEHFVNKEGKDNDEDKAGVKVERKTRIEYNV